MRVKIGGHSPFDIPHLACAGRFFPTKGYREVEVLDQDEDPPPQKNRVKNPTTEQWQVLEVPDQDVMGRKSYQLIMDDGRFTVIQTDVVDARISGAEVAAARAEVARQASLILDHQTSLSRAGVELEKGEARIAELEEQVKRLQGDNEVLNKLLEQAGPLTPAMAAAALPDAGSSPPVVAAKPAKPEAKPKDDKPAAKAG